MTDLMPFSYGEHQVRTLAIEGEPWFVLADLARVLGIADVQRLNSRLDDGVRRTHPIADRLGRTQQATIVSEAGMYEVVIRSDKPDAVAFRRWITGTVLPEIRKTGGYGQAKPMDRTELLARAVLEAAEAIKEKEAEIAELKPKAIVADRMLDASGDLSVADAAKELQRAGLTDCGPQRLFKALEARKWIYRGKGDGKWRVYQAAIESGYMSVLPQSHYHPKTGELLLDVPQPRVTPKGVQRYLLDHGIAEYQIVLPDVFEPAIGGGAP